MKPLFEVGEEVILWPESIPQFQGIHTTITDIEHLDVRPPEYEAIFKGVKYSVDPDPNPPINGYREGYREQALRKKPKGTGKTLTEFMDELKDITVTV